MSFLVYIRSFTLLIVFGVSASFASSALLDTGYKAPEGYSVSLTITITESIRIIQILPSGFKKEIALAKTKLVQKNEDEIAMLEHLDVAPQAQRRGFGAFLFDLAIFRLINKHGATQVAWSAHPLSTAHSIHSLVAWYVKRGGVAEQAEITFWDAFAGMRLSGDALDRFKSMEEPVKELDPFSMEITTKKTMKYSLFPNDFANQV